MLQEFQPDQFAANLPRWTACADRLADGIIKLPAAAAIKHAHIAPNPCNLIRVLAFDVDRYDAGAAWIDADLPQPNWITQNESNGHAHLCYSLAAPVSRSIRAHARPQRYLAGVQHAMTGMLRADRGYSNFLTKTPGHPRWRTIWGRWKPYRLDELRKCLPEELANPRNIEPHNALGIGRNVTLFDTLRRWAYRARIEHDCFDKWAATCLAMATGLNTFPVPLPVNEVRSVARSVARWTWRNIGAEGFSGIQARRGRAGGLVGGRAGGLAAGIARRRTADEIQQLILLEAI